jgi:hypothetical protein
VWKSQLVLLTGLVIVGSSGASAIMSRAGDRIAVLSRQLTSAEAHKTLQEWMCHDNFALRQEMLNFLPVDILDAIDGSYTRTIAS